MTVRQLHQRIGALRATATRLAQHLEMTDRVAEAWLHPQQQAAKREAAALRRELSALYSQLHGLEARIPTPETLSAAAYDRALLLGLEIDAAEAMRLHAYRSAQREQQQHRLAA